MGRGRNGNVAKWVQIGPRKTFLTIGETFRHPNLKDEGYYAPASGCFQPFLLIDEGSVAEPVGTEPGWDQHYAIKLAIPDLSDCCPKCRMTETGGQVCNACLSWEES